MCGVRGHGWHMAQRMEQGDPETVISWAEARVKIARMTLTVKLDWNWNSFQLANSAPPLSVTDSAIAPSARIMLYRSRTKRSVSS